MKKMVFLLICLCCIGLVSVAYAQDIDDDSEDDDLYAPQQYINNSLYNCHLNITSGRIRQKSLVMNMPVAGAKKLIYYGPFQQNMTFSATIPHVLKIFSGDGVTASSIQTTIGINPHASVNSYSSATIIIRRGFEGRIRLRYDYYAYDFTYNCWHLIDGTYYTSGHGRFFSWSINIFTLLEVRCRRVGSTEAWGACH